MRIKQRKRSRMMALTNLAAIGVICVICFNLYNNAAGSYSKELNLIMLYPKDYPVSSQMHTAAHEVGHYVYFQKLSHEDRLEYEKIFNDSNEFITTYSKINASENFAEEFAWATNCTFDPQNVSDSRLEYFEKNYSEMMKWQGNYDD